MTTLDNKIAELKVIPVIALNKLEDALPLGRALVENGMPCAEITLRTECAIDAIKVMRKEFPDMLIGAGTVLTNEQVDQCIDMDMGLRTLKFFPAEPSGGVNMLKALTAVYPIKIMPTGGVNLKNVDQYLAIPAVLGCGGTWMVPTKLIDEGKWDEVGALVKAAVEHVSK